MTEFALCGRSIRIQCVPNKRIICISSVYLAVVLLCCKPIRKSIVHVLRAFADIGLNVGVGTRLILAFDGNHLVVGGPQGADFDALQELSRNPLRTGYILDAFASFNLRFDLRDAEMSTLRSLLQQGVPVERWQSLTTVALGFSVTDGWRGGIIRGSGVICGRGPVGNEHDCQDDTSAYDDDRPYEQKDD